MNLLRALRPAQWTKNLVCFVPLLFTASFRDWAASFGAFVAFSALSSAGYLVNDLADAEADRRDARTATRPIAAGDVAPGAALTAAAALAALGLWTARFAGALPVAVSFLLLHLVYTFVARRVAGLDVALIGCTFVLRAMGGAEAIDVPTSPWLFGIAFLAALRIALAKRSAQARRAAGAVRPALAEVPAETWDAFGTATTGAILATYAIYAFSSETASRIAGNLPSDVPPLLLTYPFVAYGLFRFEVLSRRGAAEEPERLLWIDPPLFGAVLAWLAAVVFVMLP